MAACTGYDMYRSNHFEGMNPKRLILMLYDGALKHIRLAREGIEEKDIRKRGENLGRAIAIVSELNACLDTSIQDEAVEFLRGLYMAILTELPKVSVSNDITTLDRSYGYIKRLREIWEKEVMGLQAKQEVVTATAQSTVSKESVAVTGSSASHINQYQAYNGKNTSISV